MKVLAIETSTARGGVALWEGEGVVREESFLAPRGHNTAIFAALKSVLGETERNFDFIVVGTGPGSYSGIRVGIAVVNALGMSFESAVRGVPSLLAPVGFAEENYTVVGDARRGTWFVARVREGRLVGEVDLLEGQAFEEAMASMSGDGEHIITFDEASPRGAGEIAVTHDRPSAGRLACRLAGMSEEERKALGEQPLEPIYLRAPYITKPKKH